MTVALTVLISVNLVVFASLLAWVLRGPARSGSQRLRAMAWALMGLLVVLMTGGTLRLVIQLGMLGAVSDAVVLWMLTYWEPVQSVLATAAGLFALTAIMRYGWSFVRADRVVTVLSDRVARSVPDGELTARELDVLETIVEGRISDDDIAADLSISPATAATHVRNILRKAGLADRRDLMLLLPRDGSD